MVEPISSSLAAAAATKLLGRTMDDLYDFLKGKVSLTIDKARIQRKIPELVSRINSFRMLKTLWQMERPVDIEEFYCTSHVLIPTTAKLSQIGRKTQKKRRKIDCVSDFANIGNIVITGIAGQGKSIFLRHLFIREFELGRRIPVFIELRKIQKDESLLDHITRFLDILDLEISSRAFRLLAMSGKFVFFLDAYDEVPEMQKQRVLNELEYLAGTSPGSQFLVTTRPDSGIEMSSLFTVVNLDDLIKNEYQGVIRKLSANVQFANTLIKSIKGHKATICDLLCTPLLITLLIIQYNSFQKLPEQMSDFYESIFDILLRRHDLSKPGFVRQRLCSLNDNQYREIFNSFCFETQKIGKSQFSPAEIQSAISKAIQVVNVDEDPLNFLKDIANVTCLLLHEGQEYRFIHRSVQEYYAASFVKSKPENVAKSFYNLYITNPRVSSWRNVVFFLSEIDKYRHTKYYLLPLCHFWLKIEDDNKLLEGLPPMTVARAVQIVGPFHISFEKKSVSNRPKAFYVFGLQKLLSIDSSVIDAMLSLDFKDIPNRIRKGDIIINHELLNRYYYDIWEAKPDVKLLDITFEQLLHEDIITDELMSLAIKLESSVYDIWKSAYSYVSAEESLVSSIDFSL